MIELFVPGIPRPQGSKRNLGNGRMVESSLYLKEWRTMISYTAAQAMQGRPVIVSGAAVTLTFTFPRPKSHYRSRQGIKPEAPVEFTGRPDLDKLIRAVLDACTGVLLADDRLVHWVEARKIYGPQAGVRVSVNF